MLGVRKLKNISRFITVKFIWHYLVSVIRTRRLKIYLETGVIFKVALLGKLGGLVKIGRYSKVDFSRGRLIFKGDNSIGEFSKLTCESREGFLILSEGVTANSFCHFGSNGAHRIGSDTILGEYVRLHSENHVFTNNGPVKEQGVVNEGIYIGSGCWLGAKVTILDGVVLGDNTVVAAGSVVKRGVYPENCLLAGVPAQIKRYL